MKKRIIQISSLILVGFLVQSFSSKNMEEKKKKRKVVEFTMTGETINVTADALWKIVGPGFANAGVWATSVDHSVGTGTPEFQGATCSNRACDLNAKGFSKINEVLSTYNTETKELAYDVIDGFPGFVTLARNHWKVNRVSDSTSSVQMTVTMEMKRFMGSMMAGMMKKNITKLLPVVLNDLKVYAETGEISNSKKARIAQLTKK